MKSIYSLLLVVVSGYLSGCKVNPHSNVSQHNKVNRYYFVAEEQIPLYEFSSYRGKPILEVNIGDTISSTGPEVMQIGGPIPVEYKGYSFFSPHAKARFISQVKVDPDKDAMAPGITYLPRMRLRQEEEARKVEEVAYNKKLIEDAKTEWFGRVTTKASVLYEPYAVSASFYTIPAGQVLKIKRHNYNYWQVEIEGKIGYVGTFYILDHSKSKEPFTKTAYSGPTYDPDEGGHWTNTPTTGATIHTGPRGGRYYINSNGNKTYVPRNGSSSYGGYRSRSSSIYRSSGGRGRR